MIIRERSKYLLETLNLVLYFPVWLLQSHLSASYLSGKSSERSKQRNAQKTASRATGYQAGMHGLGFKTILEF